MSTRKAIVLLSGGIDSTVCLALARQQGYQCYALSFDYGQEHRAELNAAERISKIYQVVEHKIIDLSHLNLFGNSALTNQDIKVPDFTGEEEITSTYVPARNTIFLSIALGWAEVVGANDLFVGVCNADFGGFPDCRPEYIAAFEKMANLATEVGVNGERLTIHTPWINTPKHETISQGITLGVDFAQTVTCYQATAEGLACGVCESCGARKKGFSDAGVEDVTRYL